MSKREVETLIARGLEPFTAAWYRQREPAPHSFEAGPDVGHADSPPTLPLDAPDPASSTWSVYDGLSPLEAWNADGNR